MNAPARSLDTASKCWLGVLALAFLVSVAILAHSFLKALAPPEENSATAHQAAPGGTGEVHAKSESGWSHIEPVRAVENRPVTTGADPFSSIINRAANRQQDAAAAKEAVHRQAEYLRTLVKQNRLPGGLGNLTLEQIDEMEKKGILIE
jgi:hypothetical protein